MSQATLEAAREPWTVDDLARLPDNGQRYEIIDGSLLVTPPPSPRHQGVASRLVAVLNERPEPEWESVEAVGVLLRDTATTTRVLIPDVVVARASALWSDAAILKSSDILLAVEIVSPSSVTNDRVTKPALLAEAGVPAYWRVELDEPGGPSIVLHRLVRGSYSKDEVVHADEVKETDWPLPCRLAPGELVGRR
ncbi:MAG: Uma2 family endonuclease [Streptosporangiaceae bacterium]